MKRTLAALFLLTLAALPAAGQDTCPPLEIGDAGSYLEWAACETSPSPRATARAEGFSIAASKIPGVGLVVGADRVVGAQIPPGCPRNWKLNQSRNPWLVLGLDLQSLPLRDPAFVALYTEWIGGGLFSSVPHADGSPRPCWVGGFAGDDPHLSTGRSFLPALCRSGPIPGVVTGSLATHDCIPLRWELLALQSAGVYKDRVAPAFAKLSGGGGGGGTAPTKPPVEQCSKGWTCEPMPPDHPNKLRAAGWKVLAVNPAARAPLDCYQETTKGFGLTLYYVDTPRCLGDESAPVDPVDPTDPEPPIDPVDPEPPVEPPVDPEPPAAAPCDLTTVELELGLLRAELQALRSTLAAQDAALDGLRKRQEEMDRRAERRHREAMAKLEGRTP